MATVEQFLQRVEPISVLHSGFDGRGDRTACHAALELGVRCSIQPAA